jgi:hypothetical protein
MEISYVLSFKDHQDVQELEQSVLEYINDCYSKSYQKKIKKKNNKNHSKSNILKNEEITKSSKMRKNQFNLILNKIGENNEKLIIEFIEQFKELNQYDFNIWIETFYYKFISDLKFQKIYYNFYQKIYQIYYQKFNINEKKLIELIENNFYLDDEDFDKSNLELINLLIINKKLKNEITPIISNKVIDTNSIPLIYHWFKSINIDNEDNYLSSIKNIKVYDNRSKVLLESLINHYEVNIDEDTENLSDNEEIENSDILGLESIFDEYLVFEEKQEVINFIKENNIDNLEQSIILSYLKFNLKNIIKLLPLLKHLINNNLINKDQLKKQINKLKEEGYLEDFICWDKKISFINNI